MAEVPAERPKTQPDVIDLKGIEKYVENYMAKFDASHDYQHVQRVVDLAEYIWQSERENGRYVAINGLALRLAGLLHDVADNKYRSATESATSTITTVLKSHGADEELVKKVTVVVENISYSHEIKNPIDVQLALQQHPELAVVQDADRLDAIGAHGIGRTFVFGGAKRGAGSMDETLMHFTDKLEKLEGMMKVGLTFLISTRKLADEWAKSGLSDSRHFDPGGGTSWRKLSADDATLQCSSRASPPGLDAVVDWAIQRAKATGPEPATCAWLI